MELERLLDQQAFIDLGRAVRSSRRELPTRPAMRSPTWPCRMGLVEPAGIDKAEPRSWTWGLDAQVAALLEQQPGADGFGTS